LTNLKSGGIGEEIEAFLFDLDGTLVDTELLYMEATDRALRDTGCSISGERLLEISYGRAQRDIVMSLRQLFPERNLGDLESGIRYHHAVLKRGTDTRITSSIRLLKRLAVRYPVGIVSGSPRHAVEENIALLDLADCIAFYLSTEDYHPGKPDPACYLLASEKLGLSPPHCLVFEDSEAGVKAAKAAGMVCVALKRPGTPDQDLASSDLVLDDLADFPVNLWLA